MAKDIPALKSFPRKVEVNLPEWALKALGSVGKYQTDADKMSLVLEFAKRNISEKTGGPFAAAIFDMETGILLGAGVNRVTELNNSTLHGEMLAIMTAQSRLETFSLSRDGMKTELFTSCEPCAMCLGAVLWSGVKRLVGSAASQDASAIGFDEGPVFPESYTYLQNAGIEIKRNFMREDGQRILQSYIESGGLIYNGHAE